MSTTSPSPPLSQAEATASTSITNGDVAGAGDSSAAATIAVDAPSAPESAPVAQDAPSGATDSNTAAESVIPVAQTAPEQAAASSASTTLTLPVPTQQQPTSLPTPPTPSPPPPPQPPKISREDKRKQSHMAALIQDFDSAKTNFVEASDVASILRALDIFVTEIQLRDLLSDLLPKPPPSELTVAAAAAADEVSPAGSGSATAAAAAAAAGTTATTLAGSNGSAPAATITPPAPLPPLTGRISATRLAEKIIPLITVGAYAPDSDDNLYRAFLTLDTDNVGSVLVSELTTLLGTMGEPMTEEEISAMLEAVDLVDGRFPYEEYLSQLQTKFAPTQSSAGY